MWWGWGVGIEVWVAQTCLPSLPHHSNRGLSQAGRCLLEGAVIGWALPTAPLCAQSCAPHSYTGLHGSHGRGWRPWEVPWQRSSGLIVALQGQAG